MKPITFKKNFKGTEGFNDTKLTPLSKVSKQRMSEIDQIVNVHINSSVNSIKK